jgi:ribonuclease HII
MNKYPNLIEEHKLWDRGLERIVGLDEAGRGPLAGPVVASAVLLKDKNKFSDSIKDSKKITPRKRKEIFLKIINSPKIEWGIGIISEKIIDKINILEASKLAMKNAVLDLQKKIQPETVDFLLLDGNFKINFNLCQKSITKGDQKVFSIAIASIIAKVKRDQIMLDYDKKYPEYGFKKHKGYGTKEHFAMIKKYGPCKIHRKTFSPVKDFFRES